MKSILEEVKQIADGIEPTVADIPTEELHRIFRLSKLYLRETLIREGLIQSWEYWCDKCMHLHFRDSKIGTSHICYIHKSD